MTDLSTVDLTTFSPLIGETFNVVTDHGEVALVLEEATALGQGARNGGSFSLIFKGSEGDPLPQQICPIRHAALGEMALFLVPIGPLGAEGMGYEAVFT